VLRKRCCFILGNKIDADDALSITMIKLLGCWNETHEQLRNPLAWVSIVVRNVCTDIQRQKSRHVLESNSQNYEQGFRSSEKQYTVDFRMPYTDLESSEMYEIILGCIRNLPPSLIPVAILRFRDGLDYKDIAKQLRISECTARKRIEYARKQLFTVIIATDILK